MIFSSWDIEHDRLKLVTLGHFLPFYQKKPQNQNFEEKTKKIAGDTIIIHVYQKSQSYELVFLETEWDRHNFFSFWAISCTFTPLIIIPQKKKLKKWKRIPGDVTTLYMCTINKNHMMYGFWDMECDVQNFLSLWIIYCPFTPLTTWKIKIF